MSLNNNYAEAVLFFSGKDIVREMNFSEFEAVLEGFVPLTEQARQTVHAVYLRIGSSGCVNAAVFFLIDFDAEGFSDRRWNVPIEQLADTSAEGPDLGAGPIRLACRSQCAIAWHQQQLWDPLMSPQCNHFVAIKRSIKQNNLHLVLPEEVPTLTAVKSGGAQHSISKSPDDSKGDDDDSYWRKRVASTIKEARLKMATLQEQARDELDKQKQTHTKDVNALLSQIDTLKQQLKLKQEENTQLHHAHEGQEKKLQGLREYFEHKLSNLKTGDAAATNAIRDHLETTHQAELEALQKRHEEQLQMRDIEVMYRDTQLAGLQDEIQKLQNDKQELLASSGNNLLDQIHKSGISFVSFQPGAGHMTIPVDDVASFVEDSDSYTASKCRVDVQLFRQWRDHYQNPSCSCETDRGLCAKMVNRVDRPSEFVPGRSDRCDEHQQTPSQIMQVVS